MDCGSSPQWQRLKILIVKLSSLGDVVHAMPAVQDIRAALPEAQIDWVVERAFAPLVQRCEGIGRVIPCDQRRWRYAVFSSSTRQEWRTFRAELGAYGYDAVIDLQGLTKSALVAWLAQCVPGGHKYALANQTEGAAWEAPTRWVADRAVPIEPHVHAVARSRELCARALGYRLPAHQRYGLTARMDGVRDAAQTVAFVHGTSREDKFWPEEYWLALGQQLIGAGLAVGLPHGSDAEQARSERIALALGPHARVWPRLDLGALTDRLSGCAGVVGVDSGLSHIAVALDLPHVQIYNFDTAWRTGPVGCARQLSVCAQPTPTVEAVWQAWQQVRAAQ